MSNYLSRSDLQVDAELAALIETRLLVGTDIGAGDFWQGLSRLVHELGPKNLALLARREELQTQLDNWYRSHRGQQPDTDWLTDTGYLVPEGPAFQIETTGVDPEIARIAGPQLVVPVMNARYALNAANARWGSYYDALYGTDALGDLPLGRGYDPQRGARVIARGRELLDMIAPLAGASHADATGYRADGGTLKVMTPEGEVSLADPAAFVGHIGAAGTPQGIVLRHHGLHAIIDIDATHMIGRDDPAHVADIRLESALSAIMDCEDSVAAVDGPDKALAYGNWLGLMDGTLCEEVEKGGKTFTRRLAGDIAYTGSDGQPATLKGRALMFVRNVGHLMTTPAILDRDGNEVFEGLLDALCTTAAALHDRKRRANSATGSIYIVKPKMHGPAEVAFADEIFGMVEDILGLPRHTVKLGIMDEERRTSANLRECIRAAKHRVAFINTGFLDRTGDEIHSAMEAGPMMRKGAMKGAAWLSAYEDRNVDIGLACGLKGRAQIGKGMWAMPDRMAEMMAAKIGHPQAGANCAWVPSPTAATLHAVHYHMVDVSARQDEIAAMARPARLDDLLSVPLLGDTNLSDEDLTAEIENNAQGILGYVVRWVDAGVGCSKVPDINDIGQMEDRATCRISSQMLANWLHHGLVAEDRVTEAMKKMAAVVDRQNADDPGYQAMAPGFNGPAFRAACDLVFKGRVQPSGYTEPLLHEWRRVAKAR